MQIKGMDPLLIEIYNIRNLESVNIFDMRLNAEHGTLIVPGIMIMYDGGKTLNLCSKDKYFDIYAKKVMQVYRDEENNVLEDSLTDPFRIASKISIDDKTKEILESGSLSNVNEAIRFYQGKEAYETSLFYQIDDVRSIIPIIKYHIERLFSYTDNTVIFDEDVTGYRNNFVIEGELDGIEKSFPLIFNKLSDTEYEIYVGGLISHSLPIRVLVSFKKDRLDILVDIERYNLVQESSYRITNGEIKEIHDIRKKGLTISYKNEDLEKMECPYLNIANLDEKVDLTWFKLPWGASYGVDTKIDNISEYEKMIEIHNMYLDGRSNWFKKVEFYSKCYKRNATVSVSADEILLVDMIKNQLGVSNDKENKLFVVETLFNDGALNVLSSPNDGKYFYHGAKCENGIMGLNEDILVSLTRDKSIISNSDLLNKYKLLKYVKGE